MDIAWAFRCNTCGYQRQLMGITEDLTSSGGGCPCCGSAQWHIYAKDDQGQVRVVL